MRDEIRQLIDSAQRSGDRIGVDGNCDAPTRLAAETIRLARLAASIHLAESAHLIAQASSAEDRALAERELV